MSKSFQMLAVYFTLACAFLLALYLANLKIGQSREADLKRMDNAGYRSELSVVREDSGPFFVGQYIHIRLEMKNTGSVVWKKDEEHYVALGQFTRRPIDALTNREGHASKPQVRHRPTKDIKPGESFAKDVEIPCKARGIYNQRFQMVKEGDPPDGGWFGPIITCRFQVM